MLRYAFSVCLWFIAIAKADPEWASEYPYQLAAPEMLNNFVAKAFYRERKEQGLYELKIRVRIQQFHDKTPGKECIYHRPARPDTVAMNISAFRQISEHSVLVAWYVEKAYGRDRYTAITLVEIEINSCSAIDFLYEIPGNPIIVPSDDTLDVFVNDICPQANTKGPRCRYSYPLKPQLGSPSQSAFNVDFDWPSIRIERRTKAPKDFVVRGFQGDNYKIMRMSHSTGELRELMSLPNPDRQLEMISTDLTFCWIVNPGHDTAVHCNQFNEENNSVYNPTDSSFDQPMMLMTMGSDYEGMLGFVTAKVNCSDRNDCWRFTRTTLYKSDKSYRSDTLVGCQGMNRKAWLPFRYNATLRNWRSVCILSGDVLPNSPECHRDAYGRDYCIKSCTRL